ncbi:MAG: rhomboid family intramembrane serine protease [Paludibacter sp.]|nr:rhomboid family intramembrane serine protease [Paludibacter sp.]
MNFWNLIKQQFNDGDSIIRLIFINLIVFVSIKIISILFLLFNIDFTLASSYLAAPAYLPDLLRVAWTPFSYMFYHEGVFHILFNMLTLYWFGRLFLMYFTSKQLVALYLMGGLLGYFFFVGAYNIFPYFQSSIQGSVLLGASGSIMAIILAAASKSPDMQMRFLLVGNVKLKYIALVAVLTSFFGITSNNAGGEIAHLGGALMGYLFVVSLRKGKDTTAWLNKLIDFVTDLFKPRKLKVHKNKSYTGRKMSDAEYNQSKMQRMKDIDRILDKIKSSGYESLSAQEKKQLFDQGNNKIN